MLYNHSKIRRLILTAILTVALLTLAACDGGGKEETNKEKDLQEVASWEREGQFAFSGKPEPTNAIIHNDTVFYTYLNEGEFILEGTDVNSGEEVFSDVLIRQERFDGMPPELIKYKGMLVVSYEGGPEGPEFYHPSRGVVAYDLDTMEEVYHIEFDGNGTVSIEGDYIYKTNPGPREIKEYTAAKYSLESGEKIWETPFQFSKSYYAGFFPRENDELVIYEQYEKRGELGEVVVLDRETGEKLLQEENARVPAFYGDKLLVEYSDGYYLQDTGSGAIEEIPWLQNVAGGLNGNDRIVMTSGDTVVIEYAGEAVVALNRETGEELWRKENHKISPVNLNEGFLLLEKDNSGSVVFVEPGTGEIKQEYTGNFATSSDRDKVYMYHENTMMLVNLATGEKHWDYEHEEEIERQPRIMNPGARGDHVMLQLGDTCVGLHRQTGEDQFKHQVTVEHPNPAGDGILAATPDKVVVSDLKSRFTTLAR